MNKIADTCKVIALANQKGGVAKSFTTASLAVGLVNAGKRVLVIDADMRKSVMVGRNTSAKRAAGLSEVLPACRS